MKLRLLLLLTIMSFLKCTSSEEADPEITNPKINILDKNLLEGDDGINTIEYFVSLNSSVDQDVTINIEQMMPPLFRVWIIIKLLAN
jgi:hypothetical protein